MEHEPSIGLSDEWYTPKHIFDALGEKFDLDPKNCCLGIYSIPLAGLS